ncbi:MAG: cytochrome c [Candidatus Tectomicrobia bacterium]|nr:cytochrome c [Candidatus Tectomicrobia bacterium]
MAAKRPGMIIVIIIVVLAVILGGIGWNKFLRERPQEFANETIEEYFKYGSIGTENDAGLPFWLWLILPKMFPEYLPGPGGWASLGFIWEQSHELPVGFSKKTIGFDRVGLNCALCHTSRVRLPGEAVPRIYPGGTGNTVDILGYQRFLFACASDPRFTSSNILKALGQIVRLSFLDRLQYRYILIPATRKALQQQKEQFAWTTTRPDWGRGRVDPFNPVKVAFLNVDIGDTIGNSDMQPIWNLGPRVERKMALHWDGLNTDLTEVVLSSALENGATPKSLTMQKLQEMQDWMKTLKPPSFQALFDINQELAAAGKPVFEEHCARCHSFDGEQTGRVLPLTDDAWREGLDGNPSGPLHTDPHRARMWTPEAAAAYNAYGDAYAWDFQHFRSTGGYVNVPLDAIWIRAPYLHNGSIPYLSELLAPPERRTQTFYSGHDLYDPERMGFVSEGPEAERMGSRYDTSEPGNSNQGHLWGIHLSDGEKRRLLEYMKTL